VKTLETDRLILRGFEPADLMDLYEYAKLDSVGPNAGWKPHESLEESWAILDRFITADDTWAIVLKSDLKVIGSVGMHAFQDLKGRNVKTLGYVLSTPYEGQGLMTEACLEAIRYVFEETATELIRVAHFIGNEKSRRVIEKCGFVYAKEDDYQTLTNESKRSFYYEMNKTQYPNRRKNYEHMEP